MKFKIRFLGAAQNVTGSRHLLEANGQRILVDCGMYQERDFKERNWKPFEVPPSSIDAVLITHAHLDHCGLLPKLVKEGFSGSIYCTKATAEIAEIILLDSAHIQMEDIKHKKERHEKKGKTSPFPYEPLYTTEDVEQCMKLFKTTDYREAINLGGPLETTFYDAGHVLGSAIIRVKIRQGGEERIVIFSGDIGRPDRPIVCDPTVFDAADYVLIESTYGDRDHTATEDIKKQIADIINLTRDKGGKIIVPSFALERSQEILYYLNELTLERKIDPIRIFLDSPMASKITKVFRKHPELFDEEMTEFVDNHESPLNLPGLELAGTVVQSKAINDVTGPAIIIAGSGMCTGGRIKHHLVQHISEPQNTIMFVGYQAIGTLGRSLVDGVKEARILGEKRPIRANIVRVTGFSAHADRNELLKWLKSLEKSPKKVFVVHGEADSAHSFAQFVKADTGWDAAVPEYNQEVELD